MKIHVWLVSHLKIGVRCYVFTAIILSVCAAVNAEAINLELIQPLVQDDQLVAKEITLQLSNKNNPLPLFFPNEVKRFYRQNSNKLIWVKPDTLKTHAWDALFLLDCVLIYGLNHADYHPRLLLYDPLHHMTERFAQSGNPEKARYDILLTDAMITLLNNLHYGKLNPLHTAFKIDLSETGFQATVILQQALISKDFMQSMESVQPKIKDYVDLQIHTQLLKGQYSGDCYVVPEKDIRKMAINMERMRWADPVGDTYIQINIPSQMLTFHQGDSIYEFKIMGRKSKRIPDQVSGKLGDNDNISFNTIATADLFSTVRKDYNLGNLQVEHAAKLAVLLRGERVASDKSVPVMVTYFTCDVQDYGLVTYKDVYQLDGKLEDKLYQTAKNKSNKINIK